MFGLSISEIFVIAIVALIVIGPERLPKTARALGLLVGRAQRYVNDIKKDIEREMHVDDIKKFKDDVTSSVTEVKSSVEGEISSIADPLKKISNPLEAVKSQVKDVEKQLKSDLSPLPDLNNLKIDEAVKKAVSTPSSETAKVASTASKAAAVAAPAVAEAAEQVPALKEPPQKFSTTPSASFQPAWTIPPEKVLPQSTAAESIIYPTENDTSLASGADVALQRGTPSEPEQAANPTMGIYDGPVFEPLDEPVFSAEEQEARDGVWAAFIADDENPIDADKSLEGLAVWEQMTQEQAAEGETVTIVKTEDKKTSTGDDGDLNV